MYNVISKCSYANTPNMLKIEKIWFEVNYNPEYKLCKKRLHKLFNKNEQNK